MGINAKYRSIEDDHDGGFTLIELILSLLLTLVILGVAVTVFSSALSTRSRESSRTDAITSAQAALNIMTREIGNAGYGLDNNGLGWYTGTPPAWQSDCTTQRLRFRTNVNNNDGTTAAPGEDVTYYLDGTGANQSVVRHDNNTGETSGIINRISNVSFAYTNYVNVGTTPIGPSPTTGKITITLTVNLPDVVGQPAGRTVTVQSDVTLRNSPYMLSQY